MDRHEYKRQNEKRAARIKTKQLEEAKAKNKGWRPKWWEPPSDRFSFFVAAFTGALAFFSVWQLIMIRGQLDAMETDKRPWLKVDVFITKPISFTEWGYAKGINVPLTFSVKNYGQAPAINVRINPLMLPHPGISREGVLDSFQKGQCDEARKLADENPIGGLAIFPTELGTDARTIGIANAYQADERVLFSVLGCVDYTYGNGRHGQTGFRLRLGQDINKREVGLPLIHGAIQPYDEPISSELLAKGYPTVPPKVGYMQSSDIFFRSDETGNYAK